MRFGLQMYCWLTTSPLFHVKLVCVGLPLILIIGVVCEGFTFPMASGVRLPSQQLVYFPVPRVTGLPEDNS